MRNYRYFYVLRDCTEYQNVLGCFDTIVEVALFLGVTTREIFLQASQPLHHLGSDVFAVWQDKILYRYDVKVLESL